MQINKLSVSPWAQMSEKSHEDNLPNVSLITFQPCRCWTPRTSRHSPARACSPGLWWGATSSQSSRHIWTRVTTGHIIQLRTYCTGPLSGGSSLSTSAAGREMTVRVRLSPPDLIRSTTWCREGILSRSCHLPLSPVCVSPPPHWCRSRQGSCPPWTPRPPPRRPRAVRPRCAAEARTDPR